MARAGIEQPISRYTPAARPFGHCCVFATWVRFAKMDRCWHAAPQKQMTRSTMRVASALQKSPERRSVRASCAVLDDAGNIQDSGNTSQITNSNRDLHPRSGLAAARVAAICCSGIARSAAHVATIAGTRPAANAPTRRMGHEHRMDILPPTYCCWRRQAPESLTTAGRRSPR